MSLLRVSVFTFLAMIAFAGNSLLCRLALKQTSIDPTSFTSVRLIAGAMVLALLAYRSNRDQASSPSGTTGNWWSAVALFTYAVCFSLAYVGLPTASGALILFGAVQASMILIGIWRGERLHGWQWMGLALACAGLIALMLPGLAAPAWSDALLMLVAGGAWGVYSLRGKNGGNPLRVTAGNFLRCVPLSLLMSAWMVWQMPHQVHLDLTGVLYAIASGALASGVGYAIWYSALPGLPAATAASVQLSVPVIAAVGGIVFLHESLSSRLLVTSVAILGGIALVILGHRKK